MIKIVNGDLLQAKEDIIGHQVNCRGKFNSGIAKQVREQFHNAYISYMETCLNNQFGLLGKVQIVRVSPKKYIANIFGQDNFGYDKKKYTNYEALYNALSKLKSQSKKYNKSVALPYNLGSERGGADWDIVYKMIEKIFEDYEVTLYRYDMEEKQYV